MTAIQVENMSVRRESKDVTQIYIYPQNIKTFSDVQTAINGIITKI